ncbi:MAG: hypothetical protein KDB01_21895 [Planctomycetaceae bacterium]|nr:hypothetical protein [Planctomycetaceae bacterium]
MSIHRNRRRKHKGIACVNISAEVLECRALLAVTIQNLSNINKTNPWADVKESVAVGNNLYFVAAENNSPNLDLWKSNGTSNGTIRLAGLGPSDNLPRQLTNVNGTLYFRGYSAAEGFELWKSTGTTAGTTLVSDLRPGKISSTLTDLTNVNGTLFFSGNGDLFKSDGSAAGTLRVKDVNVGARDEAANLLQVGNTLFFTVQIPDGGTVLYRTNGTRAGTTVVHGATRGPVTDLTKVGPELYFVANTKELWRVNEAGTKKTMIYKSLNPNGIGDLVDFDGTLFFTRDSSQIMKSDGTAMGTVSVKYVGDSAHELFVSNGLLYFSGGTAYFGHGEELWRSDGTESGTIELKDINPRFNEGYGYGSYPSSFTESGGNVFFRTTSGLWKTDGTAAGTISVDPLGSKPVDVAGKLYFVRRDSGGVHLQKLPTGQTASTEVKRTGPGSGNSNPGGQVVHNGVLYFSANDGITGNELRRRNSDGTIDLVADITPGAADTTIIDLTSVNGLLYFSVVDSSFRLALWRSDGTSSGTFRLADVKVTANNRDASLSKFVPVNDFVYFSGAVADNIELWKSDGTVSGTAVVKDIFPGGSYNEQYGFTLNSSQPSDITNVNGTLFFAATDGNGGRELWKSDGTVSGTVMVKDIYAGKNYYTDPYEAYSSNPVALTNVNGTLHFMANDGTGLRFFESDGTAGGTVAVSTTIPGLKSVGATKRIGQKLYFVGSDSSVLEELWISDGTPAGTKLLKDIRPGNPYRYRSQISHMTELDGTLYFTANDGVHGVELWKSNGTSRGTIMVRDIRTGLVNDAPASSSPSDLTVMNGVLFFSADDGKNGRELWRTNGAGSGATKLPEIIPGPGSTSPSNMLVWNNSLLFSAESVIGREFFQLRVKPPVLTLNTTPISYSEGQRLKAIAPDAILSDSDRKILPGGQLTVSLPNPVVGDALGFVQFARVEQVSTSVHQDGVVFGTISSASTPTHLSIIFNPNATIARIQELIRSIGFYSTSDNPTARNRGIRIKLEDGQSGIANRNVQVQVTPVNTKPTLDGLKTVSYQLNNPAGVAFAEDVTVSDVDSPNFDGGELRVSLSGADLQNMIIYLSGSLFSLDSLGTVRRAGVVIGTADLNSGIGGQPFVVRFNAAARLSVVTGLLRALRFRTSNSTATFDRPIGISLSDGDGGENTLRYVQVRITT